MAAPGRDHARRNPPRANDSGQALVEFAISATLMLTLVFAVVDFSRAIFIKEVITNLTGEGSSMASRGSTLSDTAAAVVAASAPLSLSLNGTVIISSVFNNNNNFSSQDKYPKAAWVRVAKSEIALVAQLSFQPWSLPNSTRRFM